MQATLIAWPTASFFSLFDVFFSASASDWEQFDAFLGTAEGNYQTI